MASSSTTSPGVILLGPFFGMLLSAITVGIVGTQAWTYFHGAREDNASLKLTVSILLLFVLTTNYLNIAMMFDYTVSHFGVLAEIERLPLFLVAELIISGIPVVMADFFFASRVHHLSHKIAYVIAVMAVSAFACGCVSAGFLFNKPAREELELSWVKYPLVAQNLLRVGAAVLSSVSICYGYRSSLASTKRTKSVLQQIVQFTVTRGFLLVVAQIVETVMFVLEPSVLRWMMFHMMLDKIYVITMLAMLNARASFRETLSPPAVTTGTDFLAFQNRSLSNSKWFRCSKNVPMMIGTSIQTPTGPTFINGESDIQRHIDMATMSIHSGPFSAGIIVSQEKITAVDY